MNNQIELMAEEQNVDLGKYHNELDGVSEIDELENNKIYLAESFGGQWEDSWNHIEKAFLDKDKAEKYIKLYNLQLEAIKINNNMDYEKSYEYCKSKQLYDNCKHESCIYDECDNYFHYDYSLEDECGCMLVEVELVE